MVPVCIWSLLSGRGSQIVWDHGGAFLWDCHVSLHSLQPVTSHTGHSATDTEERRFHGRYDCEGLVPLGLA